MLSPLELLLETLLFSNLIGGFLVTLDFLYSSVDVLFSKLGSSLIKPSLFKVKEGVEFGTINVRFPELILLPMAAPKLTLIPFLLSYYLSFAFCLLFYGVKCVPRRRLRSLLLLFLGIMGLVSKANSLS